MNHINNYKFSPFFFVVKKISLEKYLNKKEEELAKLEKDVSFLRKIKMPLTLEEYGSGEIQFFSEDYSLATNFKIEKRNGKCNLGGMSTYDGGYHYYVDDFYPQFYFDFKNGKKSVLVYVQHKGFDEDEKIVCRRIEGCTGSGDYTNETRKEEKYIDVKKVLSFFEKKGVNKNLINKLEEKIEEIKKY